MAGSGRQHASQSIANPVRFRIIERMITVTETMMISPGLRLAVLDFDGRRLLVSVGRGGVTLVDRGDS